VLGSVEDVGFIDIATGCHQTHRPGQEG
jgi:hypothetical protein